MQYPMAAIYVNDWAREQGKAWVGSLSVMSCGVVMCEEGWSEKAKEMQKVRYMLCCLELCTISYHHNYNGTNPAASTCLFRRNIFTGALAERSDIAFYFMTCSCSV